MAKYCDEFFGDLLLKDPLPDFPVNPLGADSMKLNFVRTKSFWLNICTVEITDKMSSKNHAQKFI
jgi:hypothetical protein